MYIKVNSNDNGVTIEIGDSSRDDTFTLKELFELTNCALLQETRARNIIMRRDIPFEDGKETAVYACLSHLDNLR